jgi:phosphoribosylformylglycinamidine (FGAM) synthase-like enzyme
VAAPRVPAAADYVKIEPGHLGQRCLAVLGLTSIASKHYIYRHYDSEVKGLSVVKPGEADACVMALPETGIGIATSVDGNPRYASLDAFTGALMTVCESVRNIACVGAVPIALTDCLNFGNPEEPSVFRDFTDTVRAIGEAARALCPYGTDEPIPVVSGNVSFYNHSSRGTAIPPSPIVGCYGVLDDYSVASSLAFKRSGSSIFVVGPRRRGLGGSALLAVLGLDGGRLPEIDLDAERNNIHAVTEIVRNRLALACHDISEGGLFVALAEMVLGGWCTGRIGADVSVDFGGDLAIEEVLLGEAGGFVIEAAADSAGRVEGILRQHGAVWVRIGATTPGHSLVIRKAGRRLVCFSGGELAPVWMDPVEKAMR